MDITPNFNQFCKVDLSNFEKGDKVYFCDRCGWSYCTKGVIANECGKCRRKGQLTYYSNITSDDLKKYREYRFAELVKATKNTQDIDRKLYKEVNNA